MEVFGGFPFGGEAFVEWVRYMFGEWSVFVDVEVAFVDAGVGDAPDWVGEHVVAIGR